MVSVEICLNELDENTLLSGSESFFKTDALNSLEKEYKIHFLPAARFTDLDINKSHEFFKNKLCRQIFVKFFRESFEQITGNYFSLESIIFKKLFQGI